MSTMLLKTFYRQAAQNQRGKRHIEKGLQQTGINTDQHRKSENAIFNQGKQATGGSGVHPVGRKPNEVQKRGDQSCNREPISRQAIIVIAKNMLHPIRGYGRNEQCRYFTLLVKLSASLMRCTRLGNLNREKSKTSCFYDCIVHHG